MSSICEWPTSWSVGPARRAHGSHVASGCMTAVETHVYVDCLTSAVAAVKEQGVLREGADTYDSAMSAAAAVTVTVI